jgi:pimeloyl-ACP methyl ester carboxylesterase
MTTANTQAPVIDAADARVRQEPIVCLLRVLGRCSGLCLPEVPQSVDPKPHPDNDSLNSPVVAVGDPGRTMGYMAAPVTMAKTLVTDDGVPIDTVHLAQDSDLAIVVAHGFTLSWQRPMVWGIANRLNRMAGVVSFDFRGHGRSGGLSTLGDKEIQDLDVAIRYAHELGYERVAAVGFSMGASIVLRYAGLVGGRLDALASVSSPGWWYYRGTERMRRVHFAVEHRVGRLITKMAYNTRVTSEPWDPVPVPPDQAAAQIPGIPLLVVHGDQDPYFPVEHAEQIFRAARDPKELWLVPGFGHAESACQPALTDRIGGWVADAAGAPGALARARAAGIVVTGPPPWLDGAETAENAAEAAGAGGLPPASDAASDAANDAEGSSGYQPEGSGMPSL